jgi:hypothetical protein
MCVHGLIGTRSSLRVFRYVSLVYLAEFIPCWILQFLGSVRTNAIAHSHLTLLLTVSILKRCVSRFSSPPCIENSHCCRLNTRNWEVIFHHPVVCALLHSLFFSKKCLINHKFFTVPGSRGRCRLNLGCAGHYVYYLFPTVRAVAEL